MREILFRGKRIDNGEWIEGFFVKVGGHCYILTGRLLIIDRHIGFVKHEVIPSTVGQYTGLTDKNDKNGKNGKLIFEGDILQSGNIKGTVKYSNKRAAFVFKWRRFTFHGGDFFKECILSDFGGFSSLAVIGNAHDNPELLEVSSNE